MQLKIQKEKTPNPEQFARRCGYGRIFDRRSKQISYARRLGGGLYPRFHLYIEEKGEYFLYNLHLDQRATRYKGVTAHSGEYDGELVSGEMKRIKSFITTQ